VQGFEARLLELAGDVLTAVGRGELAAESPVVRAAAAALAELRRTPEPVATLVPMAAPTAGLAATGERSGRGPRVAPAVEQVLGVARSMREGRRSFAAACAAVADDLGTSGQAVRNACTRWLGASAAEWQPLLIDGAEAGVIPLAHRVAERCPWLGDRVAREFGVAPAALAPLEPAATGSASAGR
jgi:hypothetical protein